MQTLNLRGCLNLIGLPKGISELINLRHLDMDVSCLLLSMPPGVGHLAELQTLAAFVVGKQNGCRINELKNLANLRGTLSILRLENATSLEEAKEAALDKKKYLDKLDLHWTELQDGLELLENLQPHTQVQELEIVGYGGIKFPYWMGDPLFSKLSTISLHGCRKCELLPPLGKLPSLKSLCISDMDAVKTIHHHFYGRNMDSKNSDLGGIELEAVPHNVSMFNAFPGLENLTINAMNKLELWIEIEEGDFPRLQKLNISGCSKLTTLPELLLLSSLKQLEISRCPSLKSLPSKGLPTSLQYFVIIDCPLLKEQCHKDEGHDWGKLIDISNVWIDYEQMSQGLVNKLESSANMIEEDEMRKLETAKLQARSDQLIIMEDCKPTIPVVEGKENVISATENFVPALETDSNLTASMRKILEDLNIQLSTLNVQSESKQGIGKIEKQLSSVEEKITRWESDHSMVRQSSQYLQAVDEVRNLAKCLEILSLGGDENVKELFRHTHGVLQIAMAGLKEKFSYILSQNTQSFEPENMFEDDPMHDFSGISMEYYFSDISMESGQVEELVQGDSSGQVSEDSFIHLNMTREIAVEEVQSDSSSRVSVDSLIDLVHPNVISELKCIANVMIASSYDQECCQAYISTRKEALDECLILLEVEKMSIEEVTRMDWSDLNIVIKKWLRAMKTFAKVYFPSEKQLCEQIFGDISSVSSFCFFETSKPSILRLLSFGEAIAIGPLSPEKLFRILDMYEVLSDLLPHIDDLFLDEVGSFIKTEYHEVLKRLGDCVVGTYSEFENAVGSYQSTAPFAGGGIHPLTRYVMNYIKFSIDYSDTFNFLLRSHNGEGSVSMLPKLDSVDEKNKGESSSYCFTPIAHRLRSVTITLESNLKTKSNLYKDGALQHFFLMNNIHYMVQKVKSSELRAFFGDDWIRQHNWKFQQEAMNYERSTWSSVLILLRDDGINQGSNSATRTVLKERFKSFNVAFDEVYKNQTGWLIHDPQLREDLRISVSLKVIQAYRTFLGRHACQLDGDRHIERYIKYSADDLQNYLLDFFEGSPRSLHNSRKR
ncbi:Exocyst complex component exo70e2 [Thalictrum thalictroides]|uniref:Exocyst complex component exo70e2 n=1 Tax=Thalictrum thalictroides TaxID=46969 RepID=A0A7J6WBM8_THATH|nr:Exocyst complex component exo70e2 [Thalictrum thalictroides]